MATPNHPPRYALRSGATTNEHHEAVDESDDSFDEMAESPESPTPAPRSTVRRKLEGATGKSGGIKKASSKQPASNSKAINKGSNNTTSNKQSGSKKTGTKRELVPTPKTNKDKKAAESEAITTPNSSNKRVRRVLFPDAPSSGPRTRPFPSAPGSRESVRRQIAAQVSSPIGVYLESSRGVWNADQPAALNYTSRVNGLPRVPGPANPSPFGVVRNLSGLPTVGPGGGISFFSHRSMTPTEPPISDSHWGRSGRPDPAAFDHFEDEDEDDIDAPCDEDALPAPVSHARWDGTRLVWDGEDGGGGPVAAALSARPSLAGNNAPSRGFVSSSAIDPGNPYATFLRSMGGGVPAVTKTWGQQTRHPATMADRAGEPYNMPPYPGGPRMPDIDEENDQDSVEYQLLQLKAYEYAQSDNANNTRLSSLHGLPGGAQHSAPGYNHHLGETQTDIEALSRMAHVNSASEPTEYTRPSTDPSEHGYLPAPNPNGAIPAHNPNRNDGAMPAPNPIIIDSDDSDPGRPLPHMPPAIDSLDVYNPSINPAAGYWNHPGFPLHPPIPFSQPLPSFDTDPYLPFAPWRVSILRPFHPETTNRMILAPQRYLHVLGHLYPSALFALARYPVSQNPVLRLTGTALLDSIRLHHPQMLSAEMLDVVHRAGAEARDEMYLVRLHTRDWPIGGVALMPNSEDAMRFVESIKGSFDVLGGGQEVFYYRACDVVLKSGRDGKRKGIWVCRAYEGRQGPQDDVIVGEWLAAGGVRGVLGEEEAEEREVMVRMGEVMEEKAPVRGRRA
ncbi:hypothetical protein C8A05DRAFT_33430 [Staphylotrichum tortipilum]|uniref:Uncharacterized protein n=1 Tax=Staphylotrichum tortipilum TaxID=2831512 RepID=A0AAN6RUR9_9PEZI|nr:hypothetical protein C8A05DRAFT_33430 [Staphylotrichum longicolle]